MKPHQSHFKIFTIILLIFIGLLLTVLYWPSNLHLIDQLIQQLLHVYRPAWLTKIIIFITSFGNPLQTTCIISSLVIILALLHQIKASLFIFATCSSSVIINTILKNTVRRPRPMPRLIEIGGYSFPSGHSIISVALYGALIIVISSIITNQVLKRSLTIFCMFLLITVPLSRIYLNVHYPTDVIAGMSLGYLILMTWYLIFYGGKRNA